MTYPEKESSTVEIKETLPQKNQIVKTIVGFCNHLGGKIVIGVDNTGKIIGLSDEEINYILEHLDRKIYELTSPPIIPLIYSQTFGEKTIVVIKVAPGMNKPYYLRSEGIEMGTYMRIGRNTLRATSDMIEELKLFSKGQSYDSQPVYHATVNDLDFEKIEHFLKKKNLAAPGAHTIDESLKAYSLTTQIHAHTYPTVGGILTFGKQPQKFLPEAFIVCSRFAGIEGREALATYDCLGTLSAQFREAYDFVLSKLNRSFTIAGPVRTEQYELPEIAVREAIINALIHRNYHIQSTIRITIYDNRIEILSPGGFPGPLSEENYLMGFTYTRNAIISRVFREAGYSEKMGTGLRTIFSQYSQWGLEKPTITEVGNFVKYILPRPTLKQKTEIPSTDVNALILKLFEISKELTIADLITELSLPRATAGRRLANLVQKGILMKIGKGKATRYQRVGIQSPLPEE